MGGYMSRFGPLQEWQFEDKQDQLWEWVNSGCNGLIGFTKLPEECLIFCLEQYARFGIEVPERLVPVVEAAASVPFFFADVVDPYMLLHGTSDVNFTLDWGNYTFEVKDEYTGRYYEASPEYFESFVYDPRQSEENFINILSRPGLENTPYDYELSELLFGSDFGDSCIDSLNQDTRQALFEYCRIDGVINNSRVEAFCKLAAWAGYAWLIGPLGSRYREQMDIFYVASRYGECILLDGCVIAPDSYKKLERSPLSCHRCGIAAWCIEMCLVDGGTRYVCEHCLSEGMPRTQMATCGSKRCMQTICPHHPYFQMGASGIRTYTREHGQLRAAADGNSATRILGNQNRLTLT
jgi:hypothetical protein